MRGEKWGSDKRETTTWNWWSSRGAWRWELEGERALKVGGRDGKQERWRGGCHISAASLHNPSSLHMIISEAAKEPQLHIWNTNNLALNQKWQARLVPGRGCRRRRRTPSWINPASISLVLKCEAKQNQTFPPVNTMNAVWSQLQRSLILYKPVNSLKSSHPKRPGDRQTLTVLIPFHHARIFCWEDKEKKHWIRQCGCYRDGEWSVKWKKGFVRMRRRRKTKKTVFPTFKEHLKKQINVSEWGKPAGLSSKWIKMKVSCEGCLSWWRVIKK